MILNKSWDVHPKRIDYILQKWQKKGWFKKGILTSQFTEEYYRIQDLVLNKKKYINQWEGTVVFIELLNWNFSQAVGILEDHGDNGWHLFTKSTCKNRCSSYYLGDFDKIAYVDLYPNPSNIWRRMNYWCWKVCKYEDRFHKKITIMSPGTVCDYSRASEGIFAYTNPAGNIGDCFPDCQCKRC